MIFTIYSLAYLYTLYRPTCPTKADGVDFFFFAFYLLLHATMIPKHSSWSFSSSFKKYKFSMLFILCSRKYWLRAPYPTLSIKWCRIVRIYSLVAGFIVSWGRLQNCLVYYTRKLCRWCVSSQERDLICALTLSSKNF